MEWFEKGRKIENSQGRAIINDDGKVGMTSFASKFAQDTSLASKYRVLSSLSGKQKTKQKVHASGVSNLNGALIDWQGNFNATENKIIQENSLKNNIMFFISKMQTFEFAPPSDNLWSVQIKLQSISTPNELSNLYSNIIAVNKAWTNKISSKWKINLPKNTSALQSYLSDFSQNAGLFLAQSISFTPLSITSSNNFFGELQNHGGFFNTGNIIQSRQPHSGLKISFLVSNWDVGDIIFEPWIAAIAQKGLIQDGKLPIKAKIIITEYSSGQPLPTVLKKEYKKQTVSEMFPRKQYIFYNCYPVSRGPIDKNYEYAEAGAFKTNVVDFRFDDYEINYLY